MKILLIPAVLLLSFMAGAQPCSVSDATNCDCPDGSTNCDLLPDIKLSEMLLLDPANNIEYSQSGNPGGNNGRLRVSVSTPNIGFGPLTVMNSNVYLCGTDTFYSYPGQCPDGNEPRTLLYQRIYQKSGNTMNYYDRWSGFMTYHPAHG